MRERITAIKATFDGFKTDLVITIPKTFKNALELCSHPAELIAQGKEVEIIIQKVKKRRSLDANAYCWVLITKIADKLTLMGDAITKEEVYLQMLERYGQGLTVKVRSREEEQLLRSYKYVKRVQEDEWNEIELVKFYKIFIGSSQYSTEEMAVFIAGIVDDAKELGIETMTPAELERLEVQQ